MKRAISILLALFLVIGLVAGCSSDDDEDDEEPEEEATEEPAEEATDEPEEEEEEEEEEETTGDIKADVFIYDFSDAYITTVRTAMEEELEAAGIDADFHDAASNQGTQNDQIDTAINTGTDLLVVNIVTTGSEDAAMTILDKAVDADLPIIFFNREVDDEVVNSYDKCVFVGTDADEAGYMQGELIYNILSADFDSFDLNGDGQISYIMFKGELGNAEADGRTQYSVEEANRLLTEDGYPELVYYDANNTDLYQACNWSNAEAQEAMNTALVTNSLDSDNPIELVIANNDDMALGAIEALKEAGYNTGDGPSIPVVGVDALDQAVGAIADGEMSGTILQDGEAMANCIVALIEAMGGGDDDEDSLRSVAGNFSDNIEDDVFKVRIPYAIVD